MIIGIPRELKTEEYRVGLTPSGAKTLTRGGHEVLVESGAGLGAGAALVRRHLLSDRERDDPTDVVADAAPPSPSDVAAHVHLQNIPPSAITEQDLATLQASVADLEAARARLRERAAALRAEMEDSGR